jgi:hypothetical protein
MATWEIRSFTPTVRGSRRATLDIFAPPFTIHRAAYHHHQGKSWLVLPSSVKLDADGNVIRDKQGKPVRSNLVTIQDKVLRDKISAWACNECERMLAELEQRIKIQEAFAGTEIKFVSENS